MDSLGTSLCMQVICAMSFYAVIDDEHQTKECLNFSSTNINAAFTSPVVLESTIVKENDFICPNQMPLYTFSCTIFSADLIWWFNNTVITAFLGNDPVGRTFTMSYPRTSPVYNITAVLTQVADSMYGTMLCSSILTVQPFNGTKVHPFTVSCQTFCRNGDSTPVCQTRHYNVAGKL